MENVFEGRHIRHASNHLASTGQHCFFGCGHWPWQAGVSAGAQGAWHADITCYLPLLNIFLTCPSEPVPLSELKAHKDGELAGWSLFAAGANLQSLHFVPQKAFDFIMDEM